MDDNFLQSLNLSFFAYNKKGGARSNKKLIPIHKFLSEVVAKKLGKEYGVKSLGVEDGKEASVEGRYYPKNLDIAVYKGDKIIATISFKFVTSNYKQNANNYFEGLMGETANIRRSGIGFAHLLVLHARTPYYSKNKGNLRGKEVKSEIITEKDLQKYVKLYRDTDFPHKPDLIGICIIDFANGNKAYFVDLDTTNFSNETKKLLRTDFSLQTFMKKFVHLAKLKS